MENKSNEIGLVKDSLAITPIDIATDRRKTHVHCR